MRPSHLARRIEPVPKLLARLGVGHLDELAAGVGDVALLVEPELARGLWIQLPPVVLTLVVLGRHAGRQEVDLARVLLVVGDDPLRAAVLEHVKLAFRLVGHDELIAYVRQRRLTVQQQASWLSVGVLATVRVHLDADHLPLHVTPDEPHVHAFVQVRRQRIDDRDDAAAFDSEMVGDFHVFYLGDSPFANGHFEQTQSKDSRLISRMLRKPANTSASCCSLASAFSLSSLSIAASSASRPSKYALKNAGT